MDEIYKSIGESTEKDSASSAAQGEAKTLKIFHSSHILKHCVLKYCVTFVALLGAVFANGYQLAVNGNQAKLMTDHPSIINIQVTFLLTFLNNL